MRHLKNVLPSQDPSIEHSRDIRPIESMTDTEIESAHRNTTEWDKRTPQDRAEIRRSRVHMSIPDNEKQG